MGCPGYSKPFIWFSRYIHGKSCLDLRDATRSSTNLDTQLLLFDFELLQSCRPEFGSLVSVEIYDIAVQLADNEVMALGL